MKRKKQLSIMEFSKLTGIKRENLRFYDRIGLLSPEERGDNNYRYYSRHQLNAAYLISSLRGMGVGIEEIKEYTAQQTPQKSLDLLAQQDARIQEEIERLEETQRIMRIHSHMIEEALVHEENDPFLEEKSKESIFLCPFIPSHMNCDEGEIFSYEYAGAAGINSGYPLGAKLTKWKPMEGKTNDGLQYYFKTGEHGNTQKPAGLYAVIYGRFDPWHSQPLYKQLKDFIREEGLCICGDSYEEYPLSDISVQLSHGYCIRLEIPVVRDT